MERFRGRSAYAVRMPEELMVSLVNGSKELVFLASTIELLHHEVPVAVVQQAEQDADAANSGVEEEQRRVIPRSLPITHIMMAKLSYTMSSTKGVKDVARTVLRMLVPDQMHLADELPVSHSHIRKCLLKLDALLCLYRRVKAPAGGNLLQIRRCISPDSSPQANYDYFCATEELLIREALPERYPDEDFNPWGGFQHVRRSMLCTTIARGEGSTASKAAKMIHMINVENGGDNLQAYRAEVRGFLSDQGTERGIARNFPSGACGAIHSTVAAQDLGQANASAMRCCDTHLQGAQLAGGHQSQDDEAGLRSGEVTPAAHGSAAGLAMGQLGQGVATLPAFVSHSEEILGSKLVLR